MFYSDPARVTVLLDADQFEESAALAGKFDRDLEKPEGMENICIEIDCTVSIFTICPRNSRQRHGSMGRAIAGLYVWT